MREERYIFNFTKNGVFRYWTNYTDSYVSIDVNKEPSYCFEYYSRENEERYSFFLCKNETVLYKKFVYPLVPKILSCVFLILTILIYFFLNETRTLFGKILMNYCLSVLMLFSLLSYLHTNLDQENITCKILGNIIYTG